MPPSTNENRLSMWLPHVVSFAAALTVAGYTWATTTDRISDLEKRVAVTETSASHTNELLASIDKRLALLACRLNPNDCR